MSISSIIEKNNFTCIKERLRLGFKLHRHEIIVGAIMIGVSLAITVAVTGDVNDAFARARRT